MRRPSGFIEEQRRTLEVALRRDRAVLPCNRAGIDLRVGCDREVHAVGAFGVEARAPLTRDAVGAAFDVVLGNQTEHTACTVVPDERILNVVVAVLKLQDRLIGQALKRPCRIVGVRDAELQRQRGTGTGLVDHVGLAARQDRNRRIGRAGAVPVIRTARLQQRCITADIRSVDAVGDGNTDALAVPRFQRVVGGDIAAVTRNVGGICRTHVI